MTEYQDRSLRNLRLPRLAAVASLALLVSPPALADETSEVSGLYGRAELDFTVPVNYQHNRFTAGGGFGLGVEYRLNAKLGIDGLYRFHILDGESESYGTFHAFGAAGRLHLTDPGARGDLSVAAGLDLVSTDGLLRFGLNARVAYEVRITEQLQVGPFAGIHHIFQPNDHGRGPQDGSYFMVGASAAFRFGAPAEAAPRDNDADGDGVDDVLDQCPNEPEDRDGFQDRDGCPDPDNDGDGIPDKDDSCPNSAEDMDGNADEDGCPEEDLPPPDTDGDGLTDDVDQCPTEAEDADGFADADGCPDPDNDGDGFPDGKDGCPDKAETVNGFEDEDGCPDVAPVQARLAEIVQRVNFQLDSDKLTPRSRRVLGQLARVLRKHPEIVLVKIEGHTDSQGDPAYNLDLSRRRANTVRDALIMRKIDAGRLEAVGYGDTRPLIDRKDEEAYAANRRVEFTVLKWKLPDGTITERMPDAVYVPATAGDEDGTAEPVLPPAQPDRPAAPPRSKKPNPAQPQVEPGESGIPSKKPTTIVPEKKPTAPSED